MTKVIEIDEEYTEAELKQALRRCLESETDHGDCTTEWDRVSLNHSCDIDRGY